MKTNLKALPLSVALSFAALLGACSSVNSTPDAQIPGAGSDSVILEDVQEGIEAVEDATSDITTEETVVETETIEVESAEEIEIDPTEIILPEGDSAEVETDSEAAENLVPDAAPAE